MTAYYSSKGLDTNEILKFHEKSSKDDQAEFAKLDTPYSQKRIILLCQIGKEGWDCQSLTSVVLSGESDSPKNMVLQTSCRCLREVDDAEKEHGLIFLNESNYKHLESELMDTHKITIKDFESGVKNTNTLLRVDRRKYLNLPDLEYQQFEVEYTTNETTSTPDTKEILVGLLSNLKSHDTIYYSPETQTTATTLDLDITATEVIHRGTSDFSFGQFQILILKSGLSTITFSDLTSQQALFQKIYEAISVKSQLLSGYLLDPILTTIHTAFISETHITTRELISPESVSWLITDINRNPIGDKYYPPDPQIVANIADISKTKDDSVTNQIDLLKQQIREFSGDPVFVEALKQKIAKIQKSNLAYNNKDRSFQYVPYEFSGSAFEQNILEVIYGLTIYQKNKLEVYFNGDRFLTTFKIRIYKKIGDNWRLIQNNYTPDFLIIQRDGKHKIKRTLIIETKGSHLAGNFVDIKGFMEGKFSEMNQDAYKFFYLEDGERNNVYQDKLQTIIKEYFEVK